MRHSLPAALSAYRGVVFDLDGTLVDLPVDWSAVRRDLNAFWATLGLDHGETGVREGLNRVEALGVPDALCRSFEIIRAFEGKAVWQAHPHQEMVDTARACIARGQRLAVFSSNMTETAREALSLLDLLEEVGPVIGGDQVSLRKPNPEGLRRILSQWNLGAAEVAYVADGDHEAALAAQIGVDFFHAAGVLTIHSSG